MQGIRTSGDMAAATRAGEDASSAVTALVLEVMDELHIMRQTSLRWHKGQPKRESHSQISEYGVQIQPVAINNI